MNRDDILAMEPVKELDRLVVQHVTHYHSPTTAICPDGTFDCHIPKYSTNISAAWEVVERMQENNWTLSLTGDKEQWSAIFYWDPNKSFPEVIHKSAATAICQCALLAVLDL